MDAILTSIAGVIDAVDGWLWSWPLIIILVGTHLYMTIKTKFVQRKIGTAIKLSVKPDDKSEGNISPFAALTTTLSATVGTGNIVGVATAIVCGGVGAIFWMWIIGILGMATKYAETFIALKFRVRDENGDMNGGAMYALERGFQGKKWAKVAAVCFAAFAALATFGTGAAVQSNSVVGIVAEYVPSIPTWVIGLVLAALVAIVVFGGIRSIAKTCEKIVPFMALFYIVCCLIIIVINGEYLLPALKWIVVCAFDPVSMVGGAAGFAVMSAVRFGAARGLFSNESGLGSAPLAAANSNSMNPARTGLIIMSGAFWDTVVICLITGLTLTTAILSSPELSATYMATEAGLAAGFAKGLTLTVAAFNQVPVFGPIILIVGMVLFSYTTMIGWAWYGNRVITYLFGTKFNKYYNALFVVFIFLGAIGGSALLASTAWNFADIMNGLMAVPNCLAVWALAKTIKKDTQHYIYDGNLDEVDTTPIPLVAKKK